MKADEDQDQDIVSVFVGSWNMGDVGPPVSINSWIQSLGLGKTLPTALSQSHDLYAFGTQVRGEGLSVGVWCVYVIEHACVTGGNVMGEWEGGTGVIELQYHVQCLCY